MDRPLIPAERRAMATRAYARTFESVAWRAPSPTRFDSAPANDHVHAEVAHDHSVLRLPGWAVVLIGGAAAVLMGAILGGALAV